MIYKALYKDEFHNIKTEIINEFNELDQDIYIKMKIDDIEFYSTDLVSFEIDYDKYAFDKISNFKILKYGHNPNYYYCLQNYSLEIEIPMIFVKCDNDTEINGMLMFKYEHVSDDNNNQNRSGSKFMLDNIRVFPDIIEAKYFYIKIDDEIITSDDLTLDFDANFLAMNSKLKNRYYLKNCFGCMYSDYSPLGNDYFGTMLCFKKVSDQYIKIIGKDIFNLESYAIQVQEIYCCKSFKKRCGDIGYRGSI